MKGILVSLILFLALAITHGQLVPIQYPKEAKAPNYWYCYNHGQKKAYFVREDIVHEVNQSEGRQKRQVYVPLPPVTWCYLPTIPIYRVATDVNEWVCQDKTTNTEIKVNGNKLMTKINGRIVNRKLKPSKKN